jgi:hypothetical protein
VLDHEQHGPPNAELPDDIKRVAGGPALDDLAVFQTADHDPPELDLPATMAARQRRRRSLTMLAALFLEYCDRIAPDARPVPNSAFIGAVYAARELASDALDVEEHPDLLALGDDVGEWMADLFR